LFSSTIFGNAVAPSVNQINKFKEKIMAFDLGDRTFDLTILNIFKDEDGLINFKTEGDIHLRELILIKCLWNIVLINFVKIMN
jgi:hypothetical protein